jgi:RNA polymerase sigma-70 factor, ECF subfamily
VTHDLDLDRIFRDEALPQLDAVYRFALRLAREPDLAQDLTQETFLRAYENRDKYTPGTRAKSWLFTICRNLFLRREERGRRHAQIVADAADGDPRNISRESTVFMEARNRDPEGEFWGRVVDEEVLRAIDELPGRFREVVVLSDLEDRTYDEIAEIVNVPVGTVKSRLFRGRRTLQEKLYSYAVEQGIVKDASPDGGIDAREPAE